MTHRHSLIALGSAWLSTLAACHSQASDPAPPPASHELVSAALGARGARAAGTDAAPPVPAVGELAEPGSEDEGAEPEPEGDAEPDAGIGPVDAGAGVAL